MKFQLTLCNLNEIKLKNAQVDNHDDGAGTMEAVYFGTSGGWGKGRGSGPWVMADLENGLWPSNAKQNDNNLSMKYEYVVAMVKGGSNGFELKASDATSGKLKVMYNGPRPQGVHSFTSFIQTLIDNFLKLNLLIPTKLKVFLNLNCFQVIFRWCN